MKRRILATALTLCLTLSLVPTAAFAVGDKTFDDVNGHWGQASVERWAGYGVLNGDDFGNFNPDKQMTRAEFATMLANMMGYTAKANSSFGDVASDAWYADAILKLAAAGVMLGDNNGNANPNKPISRAEAAVMLCRAFNIQPSNAGLDFADSGDVADWAKGSMAALAEKGMMNGVGNNQLAPLSNITRASVARLVDNMVSEYVTESKEITGTVDGIVLVVGNAEVTVKDATLNENLIVAPKAEGAEVTITGNTTASDVYVDAAASVKVDAQASAGEVQLSAPKAAAEVAGKADTVTTTADAADATVTVAKDATVSKVEVAAPNTGLNVAGKVENVNVASTATGAEVKTESGATVSNVTTSANDVKVSGNGKVENVTANGGTAAVTTPGTTVENKTDSADNVTAGGKPVPPSTGGTTTPTTPSGSGGSSGGGGNNRPTDPAVTADGPKLTVTAVTRTDSLFGDSNGKKASDLGSIAVGKLAGSGTAYTYPITGNANYITGWAAFSSKVEEQSGFYTALNVAVEPGDYQDVTVTFNSVDGANKALLPVVSGENKTWNEDLVWRITKDGDTNKPLTIKMTYKEAAPATQAGDEGETEPTLVEKTITYTVDLTGVSCGTKSAVTASDMTAETYTQVKAFFDAVQSDGTPVNLAAFGSNLKITAPDASNTIKVTGTLNYIRGFVAFNKSNSSEQDGYYLPISLKTTGETGDGKTPNGTVTIGSKKIDVTDGILDLVQYITVSDKKAANVTIKVDWDGEGNAYDTTVYTIDMSEVNLGTIKSTVTLEPINTADIYNAAVSLENKPAFDKVDLTITPDSTDPTKWVASGTLEYVTGFTGFNSANSAEQEGYYVLVGLLFDTKANNTIRKTNDTVFTYGSKTFKGTDYSDVGIGDGKIQVATLMHYNPAPTSAEDKKITFTVDWDGSGGVTYTPTTYTIDLSGVTFSPKTNVNQ